MARMNRIFDDDLINELINYIKVGNYVSTACAAAGVSQATYNRWLRMGQQVEEYIAGRDEEDDLKDRLEGGELILGLSAEQGRCWNFRREVIKATALGEAYAVAMVRQQMPQQWTAAMTFLERRHPNRWRRKDILEIGEATVDEGIDETLLLSDPEAVKLVHDALARVSKGEIPEVTVVDDESPEG